MESSDTAKTVIGEDVEITGSIKSAGNIQIDGKLNGDLTCNGNAVIGQTANVKGNLSVNSITVHGHVSGNINAKDRIQFKSTANMNGDIRGKRLSVEDGVTFIGKSEVNPAGPGGSAVRPGGAGESVAPAADGSDAARNDRDAENRQDSKVKPGIFGKK
jgi:cytoskeletal protein CcmA (bactofilin family)